MGLAAMASSNFNTYNYPYQQSSAQQYSGYQTAPATNNVPQASRQYQPTPASSQATDYMSYQAQSYNNQGNAYGGTQDETWGGSGYSGNRQTTSRAAEVLRNMSNMAYTSSNATAVSQPGFTATNAATAQHYSSNTSQGHAHQATKSHATSSTYRQSEARPSSVNAHREHTATSRGLPSPAIAAGYSPQRASTAFIQQPQRSASPAQAPAQYNRSSQPPVTSARSAAMTAASPYNDYSSRQLPNLDATRSNTAAASSSYNYGDTQTPTPALQAPTNNAAGTYNQGATTVDPMAVYDPWPEYQRKQEALRAQKAVEDAARAQEERKAEEARKEEEKKRLEERRHQEEEERSRQASINKPKKSRKSQQSAGAEGSSATSAGDAGEGSMDPGMEAEIRALMAKMREFNSKDPAMLARIWEEERRAKVPKSPVVPANPAQASDPPAANQRRKVSAVKEPPAAAVARLPIPVAAPPTQHAARPAVPAANASTRPSGNTVWPPEKKATLASAAATYLNDQNPQTPVYPDQILGMLDGNPSYIELCEQLESMGMKLDRAAFAKNLLTAVPDVNSSTRARTVQLPNQGAVAPSAPVAPPAVMKRDIGTPVATPTVNYPSAAPSPAYPAFTYSHALAAPMSAPVAEMVPIKPELKRPANKEEAARKRDFSDLIDLTQADEDDLEPPSKRTQFGSMSSVAPAGYSTPGYMALGEGPATNIAVSAHSTPQPVVHQPNPPVPHARDLRHSDIVEPVDRKKALRRNTYNIKTIARDVLLACGRHPEQRQLNQHLEALRTTLPQVQQDADLSTLRWDLIDPGKPPRGYFKASIQGLAEDADDEDDSDEEEESKRSLGLSPRSSESPGHQKVQAPLLSKAINPFKQRRGRPPRSSFGPDQTTTPSTPARPAPKTMSASAPRAASAGVGYSAFRSATQYDANGDPLPKKRGRPVGWRKNIHGSAQAQAQPSSNGHTGPRQLQFTPFEPSALRDTNSADNEPIRIDSRSPSVPNKTRQYQSFKCKWQGCKAELHNLDTLKKHVSKVHRSTISNSGFIECHWANCATNVTNEDAMTGTRIEQHKPKSFTTISNWVQHLEQLHFSPLSWELGDGPASGVSGLHSHSSPCTDTEDNRLNRCD